MAAVLTGVLLGAGVLTSCRTNTIVREVPTPVVSTITKIVVTPTFIPTTVTVSGPTLPFLPPPPRLFVVFTAHPGSGCILHTIRDRTFSLRSPDGTAFGNLGPIIELPTKSRSLRPGFCNWQLVFPFSDADRIFLVTDEKTGYRWGPYSYEQMESRSFRLLLTVEDEFIGPPQQE